MQTGGSRGILAITLLICQLWWSQWVEEQVHNCTSNCTGSGPLVQALVNCSGHLKWHSNSRRERIWYDRAGVYMKPCSQRGKTLWKKRKTLRGALCGTGDWARRPFCFFTQSNATLSQHSLEVVHSAMKGKYWHNSRREQHRFMNTTWWYGRKI